MIDLLQAISSLLCTVFFVQCLLLNDELPSSPKVVVLKKTKKQKQNPKPGTATLEVKGHCITQAFDSSTVKTQCLFSLRVLVPTDWSTF